MLPWLPRDVVGLVRDEVARSGDKERLFTARLVCRSWRSAVATHADPLTWCPRLRKDPFFEWSTTFVWPLMDVKGLVPFDLPPFVTDILLFNTNATFHDVFTWIELAELARRMARNKDPRVEQLERDAWFRICARGVGEAEDHVVRSIFLWGNAGTDWFSAGVQTLLFTPAFQRPMLALLKGAQRHWFPRELRGAEIALHLLKMGVWCKCESDVPPFPGRAIFIKRQRVDEGDGSIPFSLHRPGKWKIGTMHKAWRDFIICGLYRDEHVLENIRRVRDLDLLVRVDEINNFWK
jgi:hypothetical protein